MSSPPFPASPATVVVESTLLWSNLRYLMVKYFRAIPLKKGISKTDYKENLKKMVWGKTRHLFGGLEPIVGSECLSNIRVKLLIS